MDSAPFCVPKPGIVNAVKPRLRPLSRQELRSLDEAAAELFGVPTLLLMENAGRNAAEWLSGQLRPGGLVAILCGGGNNGGDGGVVARHLDAWDIPVEVAWIAERDRLSPDASAQATILERSGIQQHFAFQPEEIEALVPLLERADWIVDALLGTGLSRPVTGVMESAIGKINASGKQILALDLPSGLDADTGQPLGPAVRATATITFAAPKLGFLQPGASTYTGEVRVADIGAPRAVLAPFLSEDPDAEPDPETL